VLVEYEKQIDVAAERERLTKDIAKYEKGLAAAERQLGTRVFSPSPGARCRGPQETGNRNARTSRKSSCSLGNAANKLTTGN